MERALSAPPTAGCLQASLLHTCATDAVVPSRWRTVVAARPWAATLGHVLGARFEHRVRRRGRMSRMDGDLRLRSRRISRRRVLASGAGAVGVVSLGLAGCAQPASPAAPTAPAATAPTSAPAAGGATQPTAAPAKPTPKMGGTFKTGTTTVERNLDPHASNGAGGAHGSANSYSNLITYKWGPEIQPLGTYIPGPDLAESWTQ